MAEVVSDETLHQGWTRLSRVTARLDDGAVIRREVEDHGSAAVVLPYDPGRRVALMVRQFRAPVALKGEPPFPEPPAGLVDPGETPEAAAVREAMEETGVRLSAVEPLGAYWSTPGVSTERAHLFLAPYREGDRTGHGGGHDHDEHVEVLEVPLADLAAAAEAGTLKDLKLLALVLALKLKRPELFAGEG